MKTFITAMLLILAVLVAAPVLSGPVWAQGQGGPIPAPTGPAAESQALAPPPGPGYRAVTRRWPGQSRP